jgi:dTDP-4-dehydrorhamnose 3,5-epimerase
MEFIPTSLPDVIIIQPKVFGDARGFFMETFRANTFLQAGIPAHFVQDNHSGSQQGTLRGLHYQIRQTQGKLVRAVVGELYDVAVDLRQSSPTFGQWTGEILSAENKRQLWIPPGFAHGFYVISDWAEIAYKTTDYYAPEWERALLWNDPEIGVDWPIFPDSSPLLSVKDQQGKLLAEADIFD